MVVVEGGGRKDIHYTFFGNVVRGKSELFRLVVRAGSAHFIRKVFARRKLLPGKFWVFVPLSVLIREITFCSQLAGQGLTITTTPFIEDLWRRKDLFCAKGGPANKSCVEFF